MQEGLYESLVTVGLRDSLARLVDAQAHTDKVDVAEETTALVRHLAPLIEGSLRRAPGTADRVALARTILRALPDAEQETFDEQLPRLEQLLAIQAHPGLVAPNVERPKTPLSDAALLTNARGEPTLAAELQAELSSADGVDLLCAFVKWEGVRLLERQLLMLKERGVPVRVLTTTYLGASDARALDRLVDEFGAIVKVNYETDRTRLHAKAWLLHRRTGFDTAYVGSSNLSHAALIDGLEWNVRLSAIATPALLNKFRSTFDSYWASREFEPYLPGRDGERLREALEVAGGRRQRPTSVTLSGLEVRPKPHQAEMLEELDAERTLHNRHRNLVVAATGTGKTVIAALDYRRLVEDHHGRDLSLLFVAHRIEILEQARRMYQEVLSDGTFGELLAGGKEPKRWRHVFAAVQALSARRLSEIDPAQFDVVVVDEFHHAEAASYRRLLEHVQPIELLGLTATPERTDGADVRTFFDGRVASELRLWDALEQNLLCPFHYFGIHDGTDLSRLTWRRGAYETTSLSELYTGDDARTRIVLRQVRDKVADVGMMRALGFCVSVEHARYMAEKFTEAGIPSRAVSADTPAQERRDTLVALRERQLNAVFAVDLFNEGLDIPDVDTVLFLRPTESSTVFLQQLGRGLRMTRGKTVLTALDFVGHHRREFRFDQRLTAMTGLRRGDLVRQVEQGFSFLPSGSQIVLDEVAREIVLANVRQQVSPRWAALVTEVATHPNGQLASFLDAGQRSLADVIRDKGQTWTKLCRDAGKEVPAPGPREDQLARRARAFTQVDDAARRSAYAQLLASGQADDSVLERRTSDMLFFSLFPDGGGFPDTATGLATLNEEPALRSELTQIIDVSFDLARRSTQPIVELEPALKDVPLAVHASYTREEVLAALGHATMSRTPGTMREGVAWCEASQADAFFITLQKTDTDYSPTTMYRDFALSPELFHWESQSTTRESSPTGQRYINHRERGTSILLFVRQRKTGPLGTSPYVFLGPADYESHTGERPMAITWKLRKPMPTEVFIAARAAIA
ncbi:DUF3427 domain-containing protein [Spongisporangium articulatum]|uniref:DUF3427 domain-containing protein n=1 Tax=Spongisporangium articulatum TaxID=3362603 RepID=A0ABW8ATP0_9ACTN